jgi:hypothetical protein
VSPKHDRSIVLSVGKLTSTPRCSVPTRPITLSSCMDGCRIGLPRAACIFSNTTYWTPSRNSNASPDPILLLGISKLPRSHIPTGAAQLNVEPKPAQYSPLMSNSKADDFFRLLLPAYSSKTCMFRVVLCPHLNQCKSRFAAARPRDDWFGADTGKHPSALKPPSLLPHRPFLNSQCYSHTTLWYFLGVSLCSICPRMTFI